MNKSGDSARDLAAPDWTVKVHLVSDPTVGYASLHNDVPIVRELRVTNDTAHTLHEVVIVLKTEPSFAEGVKLRFDRLDAGETRRIAPLDIRPNRTYLSNLSELERGGIHVQVEAGGQTVAEKDVDVDILAYDQWAGTRAIPELLAAFSMPNSPSIDRIIGKAASLLAQAGAGGTMNGYQSKDRQAVWSQTSAIYSALCNEEIHYAEPPASFGDTGQKIRTPDRILDGHVATCLDLAMLLSSCLEQAGLNPVVLFKEGHAWAGCWLVPTSFQTSSIEDAQAIRKRVKSGELLVFETTGIAQATKSPLRWAAERGFEMLGDEASFKYAIDVRRSRELRILPLPTRIGLTTSGAVPDGHGISTVESVPVLPPLDIEQLPALDLITTPDTPQGRLNRWKSKLLDLTLRNRLLNFKQAKSNVQLHVPEPAHLEDVLAGGEEFKFKARPKMMVGDDPRAAEVHISRQGVDPLDATAMKLLERHELMALLDDDKLDDRLLEVYSAARTSIEEGGANTLFLAIGFLRWTEESKSEKSYLAPILLVPVSLQRQNVRSGFTLTRHDDETVVNPTLLEMLREVYGMQLSGLEPLPTDDHGVDVEKIWQTFRLAVKEIPRWEVTEQVHLGLFHFTKYLLWHDLNTRAEELRKNKVVAHLMDHPGEAFTSEVDPDLARNLDSLYGPQDIIAPILADSSQQRAIAAADRGDSYVLDGPPGSGKSQTIVNIIAHFLATGRTVLFVSEKLAALDVVHRRLSTVGLAPFCLQLHSTKAKKSEVLDQLGNSLVAAGDGSSKDWEHAAEQLAVLRAELNDVVDALHAPHRNDLTVYGATGLCILHADWNAVDFPWTDSNVHDRAALDGMRETARKIASLAGETGEIVGHPLALIRQGEWSPGWEDSLYRALATYDRNSAHLEQATAALTAALSFPLRGQSLDQLEQLDVLCDLLLRATSISLGIVQNAANGLVRQQISAIRAHGDLRAKEWVALGSRYLPTAASLSGKEIEQQWLAAKTAWWPKNWFAKQAIARRLAAFRVDGGSPEEGEIDEILGIVSRVNVEDKALQDSDQAARTLLGGVYAGAATDWDAVLQQEAWADSYATVTSNLGDGVLAKITSIRDQLKQLITDNRALLEPGGTIRSLALGYRDCYRAYVAAAEEIREAAKSHCHLAGDHAAAGALARGRAVAQTWSGPNRRKLRAWCGWRGVSERAVAQGMSNIVDALEGGAIELQAVPEYFEFSYQSWWLKRTIDADPLLRGFSSADHERKIREFRAIDGRFEILTREYAVAKLSSRLPTAALPAGADSELGRLRRELQKQRGHMPVRRLVQGLPTLLPRLKPCLLMSPLSVAQYLDASHAQFDLVLFDEGSQVPVWDAVGAIARGKQVVIAGDPKQLPPTTFFQKQDDSDDAEDGQGQVQDLESILDECLGAGLRARRLEWHYRSRHESLIAFSNVRYYNSRLITFPSPVTNDNAVSFRKIAGVYDRGGSRTNRAEAEAIVAEIERHYMDPGSRTKSLGVVTFNEPQKSLIDNLLDARRRANAELDRVIAAQKDEPFLCKHLESVQGDERSVILFSITYGADAAGKLHLNFGPLMNEGGYRRLNVAITRAREAVIIFSTLTPDQIDLSRTRATGVADLKHYLEYAQRGPQALVQQSAPSGIEPESPFERAVIRAIRNKGWAVHPQVGCSGYRIDIGVVDPRSPGRYLVGVECDGKTYHSAASARDRDRLRQIVLEGLGWKLHRIWSTDWWTDREREVAKIQHLLESLLSETQPAQGTAPIIEPAAPETVVDAHPVSAASLATRAE